VLLSEKNAKPAIRESSRNGDDELTSDWVRSQKGVTQKGALVRISELAEAKQRG